MTDIKKQQSVLYHANKAIQLLMYKFERLILNTIGEALWVFSELAVKEMMKDERSKRNVRQVNASGKRRVN